MKTKTTTTKKKKTKMQVTMMDPLWTPYGHPHPTSLCRWPSNISATVFDNTSVLGNKNVLDNSNSSKTAPLSCTPVYAAFMIIYMLSINDDQIYIRTRICLFDAMKWTPYGTPLDPPLEPLWTPSAAPMEPSRDQV